MRTNFVVPLTCVRVIAHTTPTPYTYRAPPNFLSFPQRDCTSTCIVYCNGNLPSTQVTVAGEGGLRALVALSRCEDLELRILAAGALRHLSLNTRVKRPVVEEGALGSILR